MIIERPELVEKIRGINKWTLVFGRRKTGKSFLLDRFIEFDEYYFVKRDRNIITKSRVEISFNAFLRELQMELSSGKTIVVDEFHRLGEGFFDYLHAWRKEGRLILVSSTLGMAKKLLGVRSPLLGLFAEIRVDLIELSDAINGLKHLSLEKKELVEASILLREPKAIEYFNEKTTPRKALADLVSTSILSMPALIGEVFAEEERTISGIYEGILRSIARGKNVSTEISSYLYSRKLIPKDDASSIQPYLNNLRSFGLIKRIEVFNKSKFVYKHVSPLTQIFYYADEKYNISEKVTDKELERIIDELMPRLVEDNMREFIARKLGLTETIMEGRDYDVDALLLKFQKPAIAIEIKWKKNIDENDVKKAEESLDKTKAQEKWLFVQDKKNFKHKTKLKIMDISDFV